MEHECLIAVVLFYISILILVLVHGCEIAPELMKTAPRFQNFPGGHAPRPPSLHAGVNGLTIF